MACSVQPQVEVEVAAAGQILSSFPRILLQAAGDLFQEPTRAHKITNPLPFLPKLTHISTITMSTPPCPTNKKTFTGNIPQATHSNVISSHLPQIGYGSPQLSQMTLSYSPPKLHINLPEPILDNSNHRLSTYPIDSAYEDLWHMYKKAVASFWTPEEIDLHTDKDHYLSLSSNEQQFIISTLAFFAGSDGLVNENLCSNFMEEVKCMEARHFYGFQAMMENIHNETYSLMIDKLIDDKKMKISLFDAVNTMPAIQEKTEWTKHWCNTKSATFAERLIAFAVVEGVFFSASFCSIFWLKKRGLMPGLCFANELISRDEGLHCDFACLLHKKLLYPATTNSIHAIVMEAVTIECNCVRKSLPVDLIGMNADLMCQYVEFCADRLLLALDQPSHYNSKNPFEWMVTISLQGKTNFFEKRVSEYAKSGVGASDNHIFSLEADF
jgi:ribonucleoside-diphosphate reductase subunit M2